MLIDVSELTELEVGGCDRGGCVSVADFKEGARGRTLYIWNGGG